MLCRGETQKEQAPFTIYWGSVVSWRWPVGCPCTASLHHLQAAARAAAGTEDREGARLGSKKVQRNGHLFGEWPPGLGLGSRGQWRKHELICLSG